MEVCILQETLNSSHSLLELDILQFGSQAQSFFSIITANSATTTIFIFALFL
jgi:hypothetical protein